MSTFGSRAAGLVSLLCLAGAACSGAVAPTTPASSPPLSTAVNGPAPAAVAASCPDKAALPAGVQACIPLQRGDAPVGLAIGPDAVWVESHLGVTVYRIDPASSTLSTRIDVKQNSVLIGTGLGRVWVGHLFMDTDSLVIDPATNRVVKAIEGNGPLVAYGSLWLQSNTFDTLMRVDPKTYRVVASLKVAGSHVMAGDGFLWVAGTGGATFGRPGVVFDGTIQKIDPKTDRIVATLRTSPLSSTYAPSIEVAFGAIWIKPFDNDQLIRVDAASGVTTTYAVAHFSPPSQYFDVGLYAGSDSLWMRTSDAVVSRIDPQTGQVSATYPADPQGGGGHLAIGFGSLWVTNTGSDTVWRDAIN
jgi:glutamine cyclotransferase